MATESDRHSDSLWRQTTAWWIFFDQKVSIEEKQKNVEQILAVARQDGSQAEIAWELQILGLVKYFRGDLTGGLECGLECLSIHRQLGNAFWERKLIGDMSLVYFDMGQPKKRWEMLGQQYEMAVERGDRLMAADALGALGHLAQVDGNNSEAERIYLEVLPVFREFRDRFHISEYLILLGEQAFLKGDFRNAKEWVTEGNALARLYNVDNVS
jgi:tetratricopeptide (TPR) repeat protein